MAFWQSIPGIGDPIPLREFRGVSKLDAFSIPETYATHTKNLTSSGYPALKVRPGYSLLGSALAATVRGLGVWKDTELHSIANQEWRKWNGSAWTAALASGLNASAAWSFCNFQGNLAGINLLGANGMDAVKKYDGSAVGNLANAPANANYIDAHDNRVYVAAGNSVKLSALRKPEDWTTVDDAGEIVVETPDGETINGLKAGAGHIVVFKPNSVHELYGTGPINYRMMPVADDIGLVSNQCLVNLDGVLYWLHRGRTSGVYVYSGGVRPNKDFSLPVQGYIDLINATNKSKCSAGTDGKKLYLSIPYDTAAAPDRILEYDPTFGTWYIWEGFSTLHFARMGADMYLGDNSGKVMKLGGTTDNGTAIAWEWISKPFGGSSLARPMSWYRMWIVVDLPSGSTMNVHLSKKAEGNTAEDWTLVKSLTASSDIQNAKVIIPVDTVANANWVRVKFSGTGPSTVYEMDRQMREKPFV